MEARAGEEVAPLVVAASAAPVEDRSLSEASRPENHARDVHILSFGFLFVFSAYNAAQNLESTVNTVRLLLAPPLPCDWSLVGMRSLLIRLIRGLDLIFLRVSCWFPLFFSFISEKLDARHRLP